MKKVFSLFVATAMSLTMMVATASAADIDGIHDAASVRNTQWLQEKAMLPQTGELDRETWDILARLYELFVISHIDLRRYPENRLAGSTPST